MDNSYVKSVLLWLQIATSELGLICNQKDKSKTVGAIFVPFDGTFKNHNDVIPFSSFELGRNV